MAVKNYYVRYNGPILSGVVLAGFGHFVPGESKAVDYLTACSLRSAHAATEGWEVSNEPFEAESESSDTASSRSAGELRARGASEPDVRTTPAAATRGRDVSDVRRSE